MEKSQHTDFNKDMTNESSSVACSNVRLWKLDTQKEWRSTYWYQTEKDSAGFVDSEENKAGLKRELLDTVKTRKLAYYGHTVRKQLSCLEKEILQGQFQVHAGEEHHSRLGWTTSRHGQDSPRKSRSEWQRTQINWESTSMVGPTLGSRTATEQN